MAKTEAASRGDASPRLPPLAHLPRCLRGCAGPQIARKPHEIPLQSRSKPMSRRLISTGSPFEKTAGYSRAVIDGEFAFVAGTTGYDYTTMTMPADVTSQSRNCFKTIEAALKEGGFEMADIVRVTYLLP